MDVAFGPANDREATIGQYVPDPKESSILLQSVPDKKIEWKRLTAQRPEVVSARPLVSLPASRSVVQTNRGVRLDLWGNMPEFVAAIPGLGESYVELYTARRATGFRHAAAAWPGRIHVHSEGQAGVRPRAF